MSDDVKSSTIKIKLIIKYFTLILILYIVIPIRIIYDLSII